MTKESKRPLEIAHESVDLWFCSFDLNQTQIPNYFKLLSNDELLKANKFKFEIDRQRFVISRGILRTLLANYLNLNPEEIEFEYTDFGKPYLKQESDIKFNISHSKNMAVLGFTKHLEIGVDIEMVNEDFDVLKIAQNFFSKHEIEALKKLPVRELPQGFFRCWTRKESFIKAEGSGLSFPLDKFAVSLEDDDNAHLLDTDWDISEKSKWSLFSLVPTAGYIAACAVRSKTKNIRYFDWDNLESR